MSFHSRNPANNQLLASFETEPESELPARIQAADAAFRDWRITSFDERKRRMLAVAERLRAGAEEFARLITREMGKRLAESLYEVEYCAKISEFYAHGAEGFLADKPLDVEGVEAYLQHTPLGVLLGIMPWNFPFYQVIRFASPNLMAGNTVMIKHAPNVPQCALAIEELFSEAGFPKGCYTNLMISVESVESAIADPRVQGVSLTGSERAGAAVGALAGKYLKRSVLELGGNDPFIVLEDVDIAETVQHAIRGRMVNAGQSCVAAKRFIVVASVAHAFLQGLKEQMASLRLGDPQLETTTLGPLSSEQAVERLQAQVQSAIDAGAKVELGGDRPELPGAFYNPTILTDVTPEAPTFDQELFGPVATVYVVPDEQAAVALANRSSFGLGGSVHSQDPSRAERVARQVESGMVFVNRPTRSQAELPFGGIKRSGYGRELSELGILEFVNKKLVCLRNDA